MKSITFTEFRNNASSILDDVEKGESITISRHGRIIARLVPASDNGLPAWKRPGPRLVMDGASLARTIVEERRRGK